MGDAKRRKQASTEGLQEARRENFHKGFNPAERVQLDRVIDLAYRNTRSAVAHAREAGDAALGEAALAAAHAKSARIQDELTEQFLASGAEGERIRSEIACKKGCFFCCHVNVEVSILEAIAVAAEARKDPAKVANVLATAPAIAGLGAKDRIGARVLCPLLKDGACSVYEARPRACRAFTSFSARRCEEELLKGGGTEKFLNFGWPRILSAAASHGVQQACAHDGLQSFTVELTAGTATVLGDPSAVGRWLAGEQVFAPYAASEPD